jgi:hypothetical protein
MKLKPILLETKDKSTKGDLVIDGTTKLGIHVGEVSPSFHNKRHIYLTDETAEIKEGDWILFKTSIKPLLVDGKVLTPDMLDLPQWKKIIASTDKSLGLPLLSEQSISLLIEYYNKNGKMPESVEVKSEKMALYGRILLPCSPYNNESNSDMSIYRDYIKPNSKGEVDISIPEDRMYTKEEIKSLFEKFYGEI